MKVPFPVPSKKAITITSVAAIVAGLAGVVLVTQAAADPRTGPDSATTVVGEVTPETALARADAAIAANPDALALTPNDALHQARTIIDEDGSSHVRYTRTYGGLRVYGGDVVVHNAGDGSFAGASVSIAEPLHLSTTPTVSPETARQVSRQEFTGTVPESSSPASGRGYEDGVTRSPRHGVSEPELIVDASRGEPVLAYETVVSGIAADGQTPSRLHVFVDAHTGEVLGSYDAVHTVQGTGHGVYSGTVPVELTFYPGEPTYLLQDSSRPGDFTCQFPNVNFGQCPFSRSSDTVFGNGSNSDPQSAAVDAHYGAKMTYDYFNTVHGRKGIFGNGTGVISAVHFGNNYTNAFWDSNFWDDGSPAIVYGDGPGNASPLTALDVAGHENTHGVTENVVPGGLVYEGESGGLNEATSDIFATMVEFFANNPNDPGDYLIGEEIGIYAPALRYMYNPALDGGSHSCWTTGLNDDPDDNPAADVHFSSGIANHFFFMLAEGSGTTSWGTSPTCGGAPAVTGIGRTKAAAIWWRALDRYFTSTTRYVNSSNPANTARAYTLTAAGNLYGFCSTEYKAVQAAWTAVNVAGNDSVCPTAAGAFVSLSPARLLDTREGTGASKKKVAGQSSINLQVTGRGGVPSSGVAAVVLNVTVTEPGGAGFITAYPTGQSRPLASNLNFTGGQTIPNLVTVKVGSNGRVSLYNGSTGSVHLVADVAGFYLDGTPTQPGTFTSLTPARLLDTRDGTGAAQKKVAGQGTVNLQVTGRRGVPSSGVAAVVLNVTVTEPGGAGFITAYPAGQSRPLASNLNFTAGQTIPNLVTVKLGTGGKVALYNGSIASAHLIADVAGYYLAGTATLPGTFVPLDPARLLDTRDGTGTTAGKLNSNTKRDLQVAGRGGVPSSGAAAAVLNVTVTEPTSVGYITVYPTGVSRPLASNLNFTAGQTIPNLTVVKLGGGKVSLFNGSPGKSHLVADVAGYFRT